MATSRDDIAAEQTKAGEDGNGQECIDALYKVWCCAQRERSKDESRSKASDGERHGTACDCMGNCPSQEGDAQGVLKVSPCMFEEW